MSTWLPPAFTAPCRKPQADTCYFATVVPSGFSRKSTWFWSGAE